MISISNLSMLYGARLLFDGVNLNLIGNNRYGVVGANGTGKSTFLRLLAGDETPSMGEITIGKRTQLGWLKQDQFRYENNTALETVLHGKPKLWEALQEKEQLLAQEILDTKAGYRLAELEEVIVTYNGYVAETFAATLLTGLGVDINNHTKPMHLLSGGFKLRALLAQALFSEPDVLLLDEPTNHLDIMSIAWLENYLKNSFKGVLVFISHDQNFLNNLSTHVLDIDYGEIQEYVGNYDHSLQEKALIVEQKLHAQKYLENKIAHMQAFVDKFKASATRGRQAAAREKMIDRIELPDIKKSSRISPNFQFKQKRPSGKIVLKVEGIEKSFGEKTVLKKVSFNINKGEKIAIIGHNGIGKSTLLKILLAQHTPDAGSFEWGYETHVGYFAQDHHEQLNQSMSILEYLSEVRNHSFTIDIIRKVLGQVLFTQDDVHKNILNLSGGEAARLLFANILLEQNNILILDEPTNHLDLDARNALAKGLKEFEGTMLCVSHDRHFVAAIANRILAFTEKGITDFHGSYEQYLSKYGEDYLNQAWLLGEAY